MIGNQQRYKTSKLIATCTLFLFTSLLSNLNVAAETHAKIGVKSKQPNFVWIISEDNSAKYLKLYDQHGVKMPNVESMAEHGLLFKHAFSNAPVCSTARSTLALGMYAAKAGTMHHRAFARAQYPAGLRSIYELMKDAGYHVSNNSKTDFNYDTDMSSEFSESGKKATWESRQPSQPFFHIKTLTTTHESKLMISNEYMNSNATVHAPEKVKLASIHPNTDLFRYMHARYLDQHTILDKQVGEVLAQLKETGELENTFVFYFGDHGGVLPGSKSFAKESGLHIPLVVRIPKNYQQLVDNKILQKKQLEGFVSFVDFAPTLLNLASLPTYPQHDGNAFLGNGIDLKALEDKQQSFGFADRFGERYDLVRTIRVGNFKYMRHYMPMNPDGLHQGYRFKNIAYQQWREMFKKGELNEQQAALFLEKTPEALYDLDADPEELVNLATDPKFKSQLESMRQSLQQHVKSYPDLGFLSESWLAQHSHIDSIKLGKQQHKNINTLVDIADIMLKPFKQNEKTLANYIKHGSSEEKYWSLISLSYFGKQATSFIPVIKKLLANESNTLVKARAIEFLTRVEAINPVQPLTNVIENASHQLEALEAMNIAAVLHDSFGYQFTIVPQKEWTELPDKKSRLYMPKKYQNSSVNTRIEYLKTKW